jgi:sugar lactone lactonase YvrE
MEGKMKVRTRSTSALVSLLFALLLVVGFVLPANAQDAPLGPGDGVAVGDPGVLHGPMGVWFAEDDALWVIDSGLGGDEGVPWISPEGQEIIGMMGQTAQLVRIDPDGTTEVVATMPSINVGMENVGGARVAVMDGNIYLTIGQGIGDPSQSAPPLMGTIGMLVDGEIVEVANLWDFERVNNPDPAIYDTHPFGLTPGPDGMLYVADAGANVLLKVDPSSGEVELVAIFEPIPGVFPRPDLGGELLTDSVPTAVIFDDAGTPYVSYLSGVPFVPGSANIMTVSPEGEVNAFAEGLTMLMDLRWGPNGEMYALQFGLFTQDGPVPDSGALLHISSSGESTVVVDGLTFPSSFDFNQAGDVYISVNALGPPGSGSVLRFDGVAAPPVESVPDAEELPAPDTLPVTGSEPAPTGLMWLVNFLSSLLSGFAR